MGKKDKAPKRVTRWRIDRESLLGLAVAVPATCWGFARTCWPHLAGSIDLTVGALLMVTVTVIPFVRCAGETRRGSLWWDLALTAFLALAAVGFGDFLAEWALQVAVNIEQAVQR